MKTIATKKKAATKVATTDTMRYAEAKRLTDATRGRVVVHFDPNSMIANSRWTDEESKGHQYYVVTETLDSPECWLDDREPESLRDQLAEDLEDLAAEFAEAAKAVRALADVKL